MSALFCLFLCFRSYPEKLNVYTPMFYKIRYILEKLYVAVIWTISRLIIDIDQLNTGKQGRFGTFRVIHRHLWWLDQGNSGIFKDIQGNSGTFRDIQGHSGTFRDIQGHSGTFRDIRRHSGIFRDIQGNSKTFRDNHRHLGWLGIYRDMQEIHYIWIYFKSPFYIKICIVIKLFTV